MDENDALSEYNKIPLGHNRTNGAVMGGKYWKYTQIAEKSFTDYF